MVKKLAILSGKGGSGKTSLSLCITNLLSSCGIKTLLVDCDLSTNGATFFFEDFLDNSENIFSISNSIHLRNFSKNNNSNDSVINTSKQKKVISIKENFDFIPSISNIDGSIVKKFEDEFIPFSIFNSIIDNYDVIIFDCQAGFSYILLDLLPNVDETLFVMEADAISSSSIRSLHLKIGSLLSRKAYQVFNKVSTDEYRVYNKISGGTFFTNIESILFDWSIRKAFALSQVPSIDNVSYRFYEQILSICKVLFGENSYLEKINLFSKAISQRKIAEEKKELFEMLREKRILAKSNRRKLFLGISIVYGLATFIFVYASILNKSSISLDTTDIAALVISMITIIILFITIFITKRINNYGYSISEIQNELEKLEEKEKKIKNEI